jgi:hypothetical protein
MCNSYHIERKSAAELIRNIINMTCVSYKPVNSKVFLHKINKPF